MNQMRTFCGAFARELLRTQCFIQALQGIIELTLEGGRLEPLAKGIEHY